MKIVKSILLCMPLIMISIFSKAQDDEAVFSSANGFYYVTFTEDSTCEASSALLTFLNLSSLSIKDGTYTIKYNDTTYGKVSLDIDALDGDGFTGNLPIGIRIAKRHSRHCTSYCLCGIGFRCGIVQSNPSQLPDSRTKSANISIDRTNNKLIIEFTEYVDWHSMDY